MASPPLPFFVNNLNEHIKTKTLQRVFDIYYMLLAYNNRSMQISYYD